MSAARREATTQSSSNDDGPEATRRRVPRPPRPRLPAVRLPTVPALRALLALAAIAGCALLVLATTSTIIEIRVLTTSDLAIDADTRLTGMDRHGPALLVLAGLALVMLVGALRGAARPAAVAIAATGLVTLGIALVSDLPDLDDTGEVGELYEGARASAESGYYFETAGGALLLIAGAGLALLGGRGGQPRERDDRKPKAGDDPTPADDWFVNDLG